mmetsp:Transcript_24387/g.57944  ORF Transcript_24387/g.57944 Transcript_24387/m.57944 type:complete len:188 (-) Transcript_24387:43-606(-)
MDPQALFADAVRAVLQRWTALNLAVTNDWGDGRSEEKRDALFVQIISGFPAGKKAPDPTELETFLDQFMEQNFSTDADDESPYEVSCLICRLHELIMAGNIAEAQSLLANPVASLDACVAEGDADDSDSDGEGGDEAGEMMMEEEKEPEQVELTAEQQADIDDGWGVVVKTTRGRRTQVGAGGVPDT